MIQSAHNGQLKENVKEIQYGWHRDVIWVVIYVSVTVKIYTIQWSVTIGPN